jgi:hypothetical protein
MRRAGENTEKTPTFSPPGGTMAGISPPDLQKALSGAEYPANREQLEKVAQDNHAPKEITERISHLGKKEFQNPAEVSKAIFQNE